MQTIEKRDLRFLKSAGENKVNVELPFVVSEEVIIKGVLNTESNLFVWDEENKKAITEQFRDSGIDIVDQVGQHVMLEAPLTHEE